MLLSVSWLLFQLSLPSLILYFVTRAKFCFWCPKKDDLVAQIWGRGLVSPYDSSVQWLSSRRKVQRSNRCTLSAPYSRTPTPETGVLENSPEELDAGLDEPSIKISSWQTRWSTTHQETISSRKQWILPMFIRYWINSQSLEHTQ